MVPETRCQDFLYDYQGLQIANLSTHVSWGILRDATMRVSGDIDTWDGAPCCQDGQESCDALNHIFNRSAAVPK